MRRLVVLCVESNGRSKTDYLYINATIKRFYRDDKKIAYRPVFLESKSNYKDRGKVREINQLLKGFPGQTNVIYFVDTDNANISAETKKLNEEIKAYCKNNSYDYVYFVEMMILALSGQHSCNIRTRFLNYADKIPITLGQHS